MKTTTHIAHNLITGDRKMYNRRPKTAQLSLAVLLASFISFDSSLAAPPTVPSTTTTVVNTADNPVPVLARNVDNPARQPYQSAVNSFDVLGNAQFAAVPPGKRLVIEFVSARVTTDLGRQFTLYLTNGASINHFLAKTLQGSEGIDVYVVSQPIQMYVEAGQRPAFQSFDGIISEGRGAISGYLIDVP